MSSNDWFGINIITFGAHNSSSVHVDNKKKDSLVPGKGTAGGLHNTVVTSQAKYAINFTKTKESEHCNRTTVFH